MSVRTASGARPVAPSSGQLTPLSLSEVRITGGFWGHLQQRNASATLPHLLHWLDKSGWAGNFDALADGAPYAQRSGREFSDSEIYKTLEAIAWQLSWQPTPELEESYHALVRRVAAAQAPDGYLNTNFGRPDSADRYTDLEWGHELYCYGHLFQAAVARLRSGHDDLLVDVARRAADHVCQEFGPDGRQAICGHPCIEPALAEFGRATGESRYVDQAKLFVDRRGHQTLADIEFGRSYFQDDVPFRDADSLRGHAVRATYLAAGAIDVAVETGDEDLLLAAVRQQGHAAASRTYITGGMGSQHQDEAFGPDWALPPDRAYSETCAGVGSIMVAWRLLLATGRTDYADLMERTLYNVVATSPGSDGRSFYYTNTLHQRTPGVPVDPDRIVPRASSSLRAPWFEVTCCPPNVARTLASLSGYLATKDDAGVQVLQYAECSVDTLLPDGRQVTFDVRTDYPAEGTVTIAHRVDATQPWTLTLRIPSWATGARLTDDDGTREVAPGPLALTRTWRAGEQVVLELPVAPRWVYPDPRVDAVRGCVAVERGPLVLCVESIDLGETQDVTTISVDTSSDPEDLGWSQQPAPVAVAAGTATEPSNPAWPYGYTPETVAARPVGVALVPYFAWANRGPGTMRVWLPVATPSS